MLVYDDFDRVVQLDAVFFLHVLHGDLGSLRPGLNNGVNWRPWKRQAGVIHVLHDRVVKRERSYQWVF